jgi:Flp pilus assembly protein TadB
MIVGKDSFISFLLTLAWIVVNIILWIIIVSAIICLFYILCKVIVDFKQRRFEKEEERKEECQ